MVTNKEIVKNLKSVVQVSLILTYLASFFVTKAFIYDIHCLRKWDEESKRYCYFIGLGDFHDKKHSITDLQIKQIDQIVARCKKDRTKLIVEDICSEPSSGVKLCSKFCINSTGGLLGGIADKYRKSCDNLGTQDIAKDIGKDNLGDKGKNNMADCAKLDCAKLDCAKFGDKVNFEINGKNNIAGDNARDCEINGKNNIIEDNFVDNIEYRFCRVASLAPVINNVNADYKNFTSTSKIKISGFKDEIMNTVKEIDGYNDGESLKKWYKKATDSALACMDYLKFNSSLDIRIADYINLHSSAGKRLNFVKKLLIFDSALIDAKIVHSIVGSGANKAINIGAIGNGFGVSVAEAKNSGAKKNIGAKQNFVVIAGGSHIRNVSAALQALGYKSIYESKVVVSPLVAQAGQASQACATNNAASGDSGFRPEPADLSVLERFI